MEDSVIPLMPEVDKDNKGCMYYTMNCSSSKNAGCQTGCYVASNHLQWRLKDDISYSTIYIQQNKAIQGIISIIQFMQNK